MKKLILTLSFLVSVVVLMAQKDDCINITFRPRVGFEKVDFDSIVIRNATQNTYKTLYYPDSILSNCPTGVVEHTFNQQFKLSQAFPTPCNGCASVKLGVSANAQTVLTLWDIQGRMCCQCIYDLPAGEHIFDIHLNALGLYMLKADNGHSQTAVKLLSTGSGGANNISLSSSILKSTTATSEPFFNIGDKIFPVAYVTWKGSVHQSPLTQQCIVETSGLFVLDISVPDTFPIFSLANKHIQVLNYNQDEPFHADYYPNEVAYEVFFYDSVLLSIQINPIENMDVYFYPYCLDGWQVYGWHKYKDSTYCTDRGDVIHYLYICGLDENLSESSETHFMDFIAFCHQIKMCKIGWNYDSSISGMSPVRFRTVFP